MSRILSCCFMMAINASTSSMGQGRPGRAGGKGEPRPRSRGWEGVWTREPVAAGSLQGIVHGPLDG